jgi:hypothetical protein
MAAHQTAAMAEAAEAAKQTKKSSQKLVGGCECSASLPTHDVLAAVQ